MPNWVLDEARGIEPVDRVPFRAPTTPTVVKPSRRGRLGRWTIAIVVLSVIGTALWALDSLGISPNGASGFTRNKADSSGPPLGHEEEGKPLGTPQPVVLPSTAFRFQVLQDDDKTPVTWSPCRPIHYVVRPDNAPTNGARMIEDAIGRLSTVTGFRFVNDGATDEKPRTDRRPYQEEKYGNRWAPVLITWATDDEVPDFGVDVAGEAYGHALRSQSGDLVYVTGAVTLDPVELSRETSRYGEKVARSVVLHELGHLFGLAHVNAKGEIMSPRSLSATEYQPGDLAGLSVLASGPCQRDI